MAPPNFSFGRKGDSDMSRPSHLRAIPRRSPRCYGRIAASEAFLKRRALKGAVMRVVLFLAAALSVLITAGIVYILVYDSVLFFRAGLDHRFPDRYRMDAGVRQSALRHHDARLRYSDDDVHRSRGRGAGRNDPGDLSERICATRACARRSSPSWSCWPACRPSRSATLRLFFLTPIFQIVHSRRSPASICWCPASSSA